MQITLQVFVSGLLVVAVLWFMWRLPRRGEMFFGWAPPLSLLSAWAGLLAVACSLLLWVLPFADAWVAAVLLLMDPAAIAAGTLVLWVYRGHEAGGETIRMQRLQASVGIGLGLLAVVLGYVYVMVMKPLWTPVGL